MKRCPTCDCEFVGKVYCSRQCANVASNRKRQVRSVDDVRVRRRERVASAPGLSEYGIRKLVLTWRRQARRCTYCPDIATTADHVLPLVRGGTNYEGNLAPCCKACNSRKAGLTVIDRRTGLRLSPMSVTLDAMGRRRPQRTPRPPKPRPACIVCSGDCPPGRRRYCSDACAYTVHKDQMRTVMRAKYRRVHGIPADAPDQRRERAPVF